MTPTPGSLAHIAAVNKARAIARRRLHCATCRVTFDPDPFNDLPLSGRKCWDCGDRQRLRYVEVTG